MMKLLPAFARMFIQRHFHHRENQKMDERKIAVILGVTGVIVILLSLFWPARSSRDHSSSLDAKRASQSSRKNTEQKSGESPSHSPVSVAKYGDGSSSSAGFSGAGQSTAAVTASPTTAVASLAMPVEIASDAIQMAVNAAPDAKKGKVSSPDSTSSEGNGLGSSGSAGAVSSAGDQKNISSSVRLPGGSNSENGAAAGSSGSTEGNSQTELAGGLSFGKSGSDRSSDSGEKSSLRQVFSEEEAREFRRQRAEIRSRVAEKKRSWASGMASNPSLDPKTQARYQLKLIEGYASGNKAMNDGNWAEAVKSYMGGVKDPDATPITRYLCFENMSMAVRQLKDYDLYLEVLKEQGKLIAEADLSVLGIDKGNSGMDFYNEHRRYVEYIRDPGEANLKRIIDELMQEDKLLSESDRSEVEELFLEDCKEWRQFFEQTG